MASVVDFAAPVKSGPELAMVIAAVGVLVPCTVNVRKVQWYRTEFSLRTASSCFFAPWVVAALSMR